jgi:hypothetical protein
MNSCKIFLLFLSCLLLVGMAGAATLSAGEAAGPKGGTVQVPLSIDGATNVGSMDLVLTYDSSVALAMGADTGSLSPNAYLESNIGTPGRVRIALADSRGISGQGPIAVITFQLKGEVGSTTVLTIEQASLHSVDLNITPVTTRNGALRVTEGAAVTQAGNGMLMAALAMGGLAIGLFLARRQRPEERP